MQIWGEGGSKSCLITNFSQTLQIPPRVHWAPHAVNMTAMATLLVWQLLKLTAQALSCLRVPVSLHIN